MIWEFDVIVVPLNPGGTHWTLALVTFPLLALRSTTTNSPTTLEENSFKKTLGVTSTSTGKSLMELIPTDAAQFISMPGIFHLDSLDDSPGPPDDLKETLVSYFQEVRWLLYIKL